MSDPSFSPSRLTRAAYRALAFAARRAAGSSLAPSDVFSALAALPTSVAGKALENLGLTWSVLGVRPSVGRDERESALPINEHTRSFFLHAGREASVLGHHPVGTGHLVLAVLSELAGPLPARLPLTHEGFRQEVLDVLARPWVHGYALDGEVYLYLTREEALVLYSSLLRRAERAPRGHGAERIVLEDLKALLEPTCEALLGDGLLELVRARADVTAQRRGANRLDAQR